MPAPELVAADLNLFVVFEMLLETRSATIAARRLHVTQSAVSGALKRLRGLLGDPLFVRHGRGLTPTPVARELGARVHPALHALAEAIRRERAFEPRTCSRHFTFSCADDQEHSSVPRILQGLRAAMPHASLSVVTPFQAVVTDALAVGTVDAALAPASVKRRGLLSTPLYEDRLVLVAHRKRRLSSRMTPAAFNELPQVAVEVLGESGVGRKIDAEAMDAAGLSRNTVLTVPHFTSAAVVVAETDLVATLPRRFARFAAKTLPLRIVELPTGRPLAVTFALYWHERTDADPASRAFRAIVAAALEG